MAGGNDIPIALRDCMIDNIRIGNQIGRGANGRILEAKWEGIVVAVKEIHSIFMNEVSDLEFQSFKRCFLRECEQSSRLRHPNIVRFFGIYHPPGARVPSLVMERLHCSLTNLLENNPVVPIGTKISIIRDVALGLRYLHTRNTPIIHRDLSSNNVLLSKGMEGKIGDLGTARLVDPRRQSRMTKAPGTMDFMPPEALEDVENICYGKELDVFSFGCVMLHTLSHQWPTPSQAVIINPETGLVTGGRTEVERRSQYFERIDRSRSDVLIPLIENCLSNLPRDRTSIVRVCDQLEGHEQVSVSELTMSALHQEIQHKDAELQRKDIEIQRKDVEIQRIYSELQRKDYVMQQKDAELQRKDTEIQRKDAEIQRNYSEIQRKVGEIQQKDAELQRKDIEIQRKGTEIQRNYGEINRKDGKIQQKDAELQRKDIEIQRKDIEIHRNYSEIQRKDSKIHQKDAELQRKDIEIQRKDIEIQRNHGEIQRKDDKIQQKDTELQNKDIEIQRNYSEIRRKNAEMQRKISEIECLTTVLQDKDVSLKILKSDMTKLQLIASKKVNKSSSDSWNNLQLTWQQCSDLPNQCKATSVAVLDGKVYAAMLGSRGGYVEPLMYDSNKNQWSTLPALPYAHFSLVAVPDSNYKQLLAIGGVVDNNGIVEISNKVFRWDEENRKWTTPYFNMPTARYSCSSISHGSTVIVAGGIMCSDPPTVTRTVEVLHIKEHSWFTKSHWSVVEQLPLAVRDAIPLIVNDQVYVAVGHGKIGPSTCNVVTASLPELLQSSNKNTSSGQVWNKLPDMPYSSFSINHYQGHLITFGGGHKIEQTGKDDLVFKSVPLIHLYNPYTNTWDCVGEIPYEYSLGTSVHIKDNKILFIGGLTDVCDDIIKTCSILTLL